ncbi:MAG: hypothetical protein ACREJ3_03555 [Polyangiaceae bacterium]
MLDVRLYVAGLHRFRVWVKDAVMVVWALRTLWPATRLPEGPHA